MLFKKKTKTNEIRLKVVYSDPEEYLHDHTRLFVRNNLSRCVQDALIHAKSWNLQIKSMEQLTTK